MEYRLYLGSSWTTLTSPSTTTAPLRTCKRDTSCMSPSVRLEIRMTTSSSRRTLSYSAHLRSHPSTQNSPLTASKSYRKALTRSRSSTWPSTIYYGDMKTTWSAWRPIFCHRSSRSRSSGSWTGFVDEPVGASTVFISFPISTDVGRRPQRYHDAFASEYWPTGAAKTRRR